MRRCRKTCPHPRRAVLRNIHRAKARADSAPRAIRHGAPQARLFPTPGRFCERMIAQLILRCSSVLRARARAMGPRPGALFARRCPRQARASDGDGWKTRAQSGNFLGNAPGRGVEAGRPLAGSPPEPPTGGYAPPRRSVARRGQSRSQAQGRRAPIRGAPNLRPRSRRAPSDASSRRGCSRPRCPLRRCRRCGPCGPRPRASSSCRCRRRRSCSPRGC